MTDRELLELAAKAAGYQISAHPNRKISRDLLFIVNGKNWNPLEDDGDAFRLALDACVDVHTQITGRQVYAEAGFDDVKILNLINDDKYAALRKCITQAAAEIGKGM